MGAEEETLPQADTAREQRLAPGELFGRYLIVRRVGTGGVGEVYAAYDPSLDRRIALKVLRSNASEDATTSSSKRAALVREAKALASLSHPNVVTVHDVGREHEQTYIAMELVDGRDLKEWIREEPNRPWRRTLKMFIDAGKGLHSAHVKGILHRDFKPANVLVGHDEWVRVSDFGLARLLVPREVTAEDSGAHERSLDTSMSIGGRLVGTPYYMAPEQVDGDTTVQSDIYSFCLALHDALYRVRGFKGATLLELSVRKAQGPPAAPADSRGVPGSLRSAIERGLDPSPDARWPSMAPLITALEQALRPRARTTMPWLLGVGGIALTAAAMAPRSTASCTGANEALRIVWNESEAKSVVAGMQATGSPLATRASVSAMAEFEQRAEAWELAHTRVCEATQRGEQSNLLLDARMACLQRQLLDFDAVVDVLSNADATVIARTSQTLASLPDPARCETLSSDPEAAESSTASQEARAELAQINARVAAGLYVVADERSNALLESIVGLDSPRLRADVLLARGDVLLKMGKVEASVQMLERSAFSAVESGYATGQMRAATLLITAEGGRAAHPEAGLRWARFAEAALLRAGRGPLERSIIASNRASVFTEKGDHKAAEDELHRALEWSEKAGESSSQRRAALLDNLGTATRTLGRFEDAVAFHDEATALREASLGPDHPLLARTLTNTAAAYIELAKFEEADARYTRALEIRERALGPDHLDVATTVMNIGVSYYRRGQLKVALPYFERSLKIRQASLPDDHPRILRTMGNIALLRSESGELDAAGAIFEEVLQRLDAHPDHDPTTRATTLANLAGLRFTQGRTEEALSLYQSAMKIDESRLGSGHPKIALLLSNIGQVLELLERFDEALAVQKRALQIRETKLGPDHPDLIWTLAGLSSVYQSSAKQELALPLLERALRISKKGEIDAVLIAGVKFRLAQALKFTGGDRARAFALAQEARETYQSREQNEELKSVEAFIKDFGK